MKISAERGIIRMGLRLRYGIGTQDLWPHFPEWLWPGSGIFLCFTSPSVQRGLCLSHPLSTVSIYIVSSAEQGLSRIIGLYCASKALFAGSQCYHHNKSIKLWDGKDLLSYNLFRLSKLSSCPSWVVPCGTFSSVFSRLVWNVPSNGVSLSFGRLSHRSRF